MSRCPRQTQLGTPCHLPHHHRSGHLGVFKNNRSRSRLSELCPKSPASLASTQQTFSLPTPTSIPQHGWLREQTSTRSRRRFLLHQRSTGLPAHGTRPIQVAQGRTNQHQSSLRGLRRSENSILRPRCDIVLQGRRHRPYLRRLL
jgi:hypothetical protein